MSEATGFHLTSLGDQRALLEPQHGINPADPATAIETVLEQLATLRLKRLYYDLSNVAVVDPVYYTFLNRLASACHAIGIEMVGIGLQSHTAFALAAHMDEPPRFATAPGID